MRPTPTGPEFGDLVPECAVDQDAPSALPMLVISLPDQVVRTANRAAAELLGVHQDVLVGRRAKELVLDDEADDAECALGALACGALDSYRAHRNFSGAQGPVEAWVLVRSIPRTSAGMAFLLLRPTAHGKELDPATTTLIGSLAVDLASGTLDRSGRFATLVRSNIDVLNRDPESTFRGWHLASDVHPDDQRLLYSALRKLRNGAVDVVVALRIRHSERGWIRSDCHLFATGDGDLGQPTGFVLAEATPRPPESGRVAQLERHLGRIAAEVEAATVHQWTPVSPEPEQSAELESLTPRQREIVQRLLAGSRVPSIAAALFVSRSTVRNHLAGVYRVFGIHSQAELIELLQPWSQRPAS